MWDGTRTCSCSPQVDLGAEHEIGDVWISAPDGDSAKLEGIRVGLRDAPCKGLPSWIAIWRNSWNHMELSVSYSIILYPKRLGKEICLKPLGKVVGSVPLTVCKVSGPHSGCVACLWKMQMEVWQPNPFEMRIPILQTTSGGVHVPSLDLSTSM